MGAPGGTALKADLFRHQVICLTLAAELDQTSYGTVTVVATNVGGEEVAFSSLRCSRTVRICGWLYLRQRGSQSDVGDLLREDECKDVAVGYVLKVSGDLVIPY